MRTARSFSTREACRLAAIDRSTLYDWAAHDGFRLPRLTLRKPGGVQVIRRWTAADLRRLKAYKARRYGLQRFARPAPLAVHARAKATRKSGHGRADEALDKVIVLVRSELQKRLGQPAPDTIVAQLAARLFMELFLPAPVLEAEFAKRILPRVAAGQPPVLFVN